MIVSIEISKSSSNGMGLGHSLGAILCLWGPACAFQPPAGQGSLTFLPRAAACFTYSCRIGDAMPSLLYTPLSQSLFIRLAMHKGILPRITSLCHAFQRDILCRRSFLTGGDASPSPASCSCPDDGAWRGECPIEILFPRRLSRREIWVCRRGLRKEKGTFWEDLEGHDR